MTRQIPLYPDVNMTPGLSLAGRVGRVVGWIANGFAVAVCAVVLFSVPNIQVQNMPFVFTVTAVLAVGAYLAGRAVRYILGD